MLGIALVDGLNPSTIAPALVLAVRDRGVALVTLFTLGVFVPSFVAGVVIVAGPGQVLLDLIPNVGITRSICSRSPARSRSPWWRWSCGSIAAG